MKRQFKYHPQYPKQIILKETHNWFISLWENQYYLGRATVEYKNYDIRHLSDLPKEHVDELFMLIAAYERSLQKVFDTTNFNWTCLMNASYKPRNVENPDNLHLHCWPRYRNPVEFAGETFVDEVFAHHYDKYKEKNVPQVVLGKIAMRIIEELE